MGLFDRFAQLFGDWHASAISPDTPEPTAVIPTTGLPTVGGAWTPDVAGNPFGTDLSRHHDHDWNRHDRWDTASSFDDASRWP